MQHGAYVGYCSVNSFRGVGKGKFVSLGRMEDVLLFVWASAGSFCFAAPR
jgi:hypothetical protein